MVEQLTGLFILVSVKCKASEQTSEERPENFNIKLSEAAANSLHGMILSCVNLLWS